MSLVRSLQLRFIFPLQSPRLASPRKGLGHRAATVNIVHTQQQKEKRKKKQFANEIREKKNVDSFDRSQAKTKEFKCCIIQSVQVDEKFTTNKKVKILADRQTDRSQM